MSGLEIVLGVAALLIGLTGAWSPCGFSMVETIGPSGHTGGGRVTAAALATFVPGALVGGGITYGLLAWAGDLVHGAGGRFAFAIAAAIAVAAALAEARGTPIVPQIRRQLPEHWRRVMPMPLAAGLYGILLGLGFTTFVLSFGVWALAGISFAIGDPVAGVVIGLAFGAGRAIPVLALAPVCERESGIRATEAMTQRPALYRGARAGDAIALLATAIALMVSPAGAATTVVKGAADPTASGDDIAFERVDGSAVLQRAGGNRLHLPGTDPALGGPYVAVREQGTIALLRRTNLRQFARLAAPGADALAVSGTWLAYRTHEDGADALHARSISAVGGGISADGGGVAFGVDDVVARAAAPGEIGRPSLTDNTLVFSRSAGSTSAIHSLGLGSGSGRTIVSSRQWLLSGASVLGGKVSFLQTTNDRQQVRLVSLHRSGLGKLLYAVPATSYRDADHDPGHVRLHTRLPKPDRRRTNTDLVGTTLTAHDVYLTQLIQRGGHVSARISRIPR